MAQAAPATGRQSARYCAQYVYDDDVFFGFTQNILAGTGVPDLGDVLILPVSAPKGSYQLKAAKSSERAEPGYYGIRFADEGIGVAATVAEHSTIYAFDYSKAKGAALYVDLQWGCGGGRIEDRVEECETHFADDGLMTGHMKVRGWVDRDVFFALRASCPFRRAWGTGNGEWWKGREVAFDV